MTDVMMSIAHVAATEQQEESTEGVMIRAPSLYVHNPYGSGSMVRLAGDKKKATAEAAGITITIDAAADESDAAATACAHNAPASPMGLSVCGSDEPNSDASVSSERRRRNKKPRKNRSAGLAGDNGEKVSVCLDYLKGVCNRKRSRCKFAHPQLSLDAPVPMQQPCSPCCAPAHVNVCSLWALTGFCKFGSRCRDYHPEQESITKVCAPATTQRMTTASREAARRLSETNWSDEECEDSHSRGSSSRPSTPTPPPMMAAPAFMQAWWEVDAMVYHLHYQNFDATLQRLFQLLHSPMTGLSLDRILPVLFGKAIENFERSAAVLALLCQNLCGTVPVEQQHEFKCSLLRLADHMLHMTPEGTESDEQLASMARKQRGTAVFLGELYRHGLVPVVRLQSALDYCTKRAASATDDGNLFAEMACMLLSIVGTAVQCQGVDLDQTVKRLHETVAMHEQRRQQLWMQAQNH